MKFYYISWIDFLPFHVALLVSLLYSTFNAFHVFSYIFAIFFRTYIFILPSHWNLGLSSFINMKKKEKFDWIEKLDRHLIFKSYK